MLVQELIGSAKNKLLAQRDKRERPARDAKVLTGWPALTVTGLALAAPVCQRPDGLQAAPVALPQQRWGSTQPYGFATSCIAI